VINIIMGFRDMGCYTIFPRDMASLLARILFLSLGQMKLSCLRISLLLGFTCPHIQFLWTSCASSKCNCIN
jgi:hypothetical protein